ncbi:hypothetical protein DICPUDRAFT_155169 [Dictyostelium purpureum]|uniref:Uncharacterized protein n=1 Tax=Dictyostelium purpureum TaxID=5786 RepID=F0ZT94_DICPU|nr:uncharacterized protein DICPUDRAFT_155169 [Dictyostelium purpureum]XP_003295035.1 uncharacterized protein DICPUDRAFT_85472 [Dictyostelium purpureum]EGC28437.1 hypothetical protein DICPUDRAFT_85472 [Dictyostelium purpureum]EGC32853.1 hypothetical protein DICPUDRAFT_155169 [Dictyostelium purpureum]|eukprot:XP_003290638.1 hypothetical protein DICPUDRAFT_155169 [Dictyostelium purpureum]
MNKTLNIFNFLKKIKYNKFFIQNRVNNLYISKTTLLNYNSKINISKNNIDNILSLRYYSSYNQRGLKKNVYKDNNKKSIGIDFDSVTSLISSNVDKIIKGKILPKDVSIAVNKIIKCNECDINVRDRMLSCQFLFFSQSLLNNNNPRGLDKDILNKVWKLIDIKDKDFYDDWDNIGYYYCQVLSIKLFIPLVTGEYFNTTYNSIDSSMDALISCVKHKEFEPNGFSDFTRYSFDISLALDSESIYKIITKQISHSILNDPFYEIDQKEYSPINEKFFFIFKKYQFKQFGLKHTNFENINTEKEEFDIKKDNYILTSKALETIQQVNENGFRTYGNDGTQMIFLGRAVKLILPDGMVYGGIVSLDFKKIHLYGISVSLKGEIIEGQFNLNVQISDDNKTIGLEGVHRSVYISNNNQKILVDNNFFAKMEIKK